MLCACLTKQPCNNPRCTSCTCLCQAVLCLRLSASCQHASCWAARLVDAPRAPDHAAWAPPQAQRANALAAEQGLAERVSFQVADALQQPFADGSFDLVWSLESGEHMCGPAARAP